MREQGYAFTVEEETATAGRTGQHGAERKRQGSSGQEWMPVRSQCLCVDKGNWIWTPGVGCHRSSVCTVCRLPASVMSILVCDCLCPVFVRVFVSSSRQVPSISSVFLFYLFFLTSSTLPTTTPPCSVPDPQTHRLQTVESFEGSPG